MRNTTLYFIFLISLALFLANDFAIKANLYWTTSWADMITHTMGGMVVSGLIIFILSFNKSYKFNAKTTIISTLFVGILWEIFELYNGLTFLTDKGYTMDTLGDLFFDMVGGYLGYRFLIKNSNN